MSSFRAPTFEIERRRNFAIISHPDAGKSTLTEKLLLFGGAIQDAGAVKARAGQRKVTSDWMEIEKQRGISVTSTVLSFEYSPKSNSKVLLGTPFQLNLLDTPVIRPTLLDSSYHQWALILLHHFTCRDTPTSRRTRTEPLLQQITAFFSSMLQRA